MLVQIIVSFWSLQWHDQLLDAVREMKDGPVVEQTLDQDYKINGGLEVKEEPSVSNVLVCCVVCFCLNV